MRSMGVARRRRQEGHAMTIEQFPGTDASPDSGLEEAKAAAERDRLVDRIMAGLVERFGGTSVAETIYGAPVERDGVTVIAAARVRTMAGAGAGSGSGPAESGSGEGAGGGVAVVGDPVGYIEISGGHAIFRPVRGVPNPLAILALGLAVAIVLRAIARLLGR
jgi:uncharacterized spore protein YtfJ